ncbi:MAG: carboxypeptidase regulatory-like domain-containing protein, partial [Clostridia bacterium]|nr:carboxypeptidase regulatory-like domain-containing protein [Clostridia bacterium]
MDNTSSTPYAENPWTIKDCYSSGTIAGSNATGALITFICGTGTTATATSRTDAINGTIISESYGYDENYNDVIGSDYSVSTDSICTNVYNLKPTSISEANGVTGLTSDEFKTAANFTGFDFADTWLMSSSLGRPILRSVSEGPGYPVPDVPENIDIEAEHGEGTELDLSNYILSTSGEDLSDNFTYTIDDEDNEAFTGTVHNWETDEDEEGITGYLATVNDKTVSFSGQAGIGTHTVTVKGTYIGEEAGGTLGETADDIEFTITETVTKTVPAPEASTYTFPYSAAMRLKYISLNDLWQWEKPETLPRANAYYNVVYPVEEGKEAYYKYSDIEDAVYDADKDGIVSSIQLFVTDSEESPWSIAVTVLNADNNKPIEGAVVSSTFDYEFPEETRTTNSSGVASGEMTAGSHIIYANAENFTENSATKVIDATNGNTLTIKLTPTRVDAVLPTLYNDSGKAVPCSATLTKLDADTNPAEQWNGGSASATYKGGSTQQLPTGTYLVRLSAYGYTDQTVYMKVAYPDTVTYYSDDSFDDTKKIEPEDLAETTKSEKIGDAVYTYDFTKNVADNTVTATVKLKNTVASMGTLGISYDPELFTLNPETGVVLNSSLNLTATTPYEEYAANIGATGIPAWTNDRGYYVFRWVVGDNTSLDGMSQSLDTINNETLIATFTFSLNTDDGYDWDYVTSDSFNIMPWTDTEEAKAYKTWYDAKYAANPEAAGDYEFEEYWRECDNENSPFSLGVGRIEKSKATVNGEDMGGFYQVAVNEQLGSENLVSFYDVLSVVNMFDTTNTSLRFTVTDQETGAAIEGATVVLYPTDDMLPQTRYTNAKGIAKFMVDASAEEDVDYNYTVTINGYWPVEATPVTVQPKVAKNIEVELEKKIYHVPEVKGVGGGESPLELVTNMDLGGERYGYNGRDFHFRAKAAPGYTIDTYPTQATVVIGIENEDGYETTTIILTEDDDHMFTLDKSFLHQAELEKSKLATLYGGSEDDYTQPNENGYRSYNIEITFDKYRADEKALEVRGIAGEHGTVAYDNGNPADSMAATEVTADHEYVVSGIVPGKTGYEQTGTFTFTADTDNDYMVEKVFINGVQTHKYDNKDSFTYSFDKPETDCSIIVTFWDGVNPSGDSIITLIVGDYGAVNVTEPEEKAETGVRETTRTYLNPDKVEFKTVPDTGYQLYAVKTQIEDGAVVSEDLSDIADLSSKTDNSFEFLPENGKTKKIYVTFKNPNAPKTPTIFVKSYVERGEGTIDPFGLLVYNIYDTVEFDLTSDIGYDVWGVKVSPLGKTAEGTEHQYPALKTANTYTIDSIEEDTEVGAIFEEHRYVIKGTVDLSQNSDLVNGPWAVSSTPNILTGALVTFVRVGD